MNVLKSCLIFTYLVIASINSWADYLPLPPTNDSKANALELTQKNNWCSALAAYSNVGATPDGTSSLCGDPNNNVWFKFQASTSYINIDVKTGGTEGTIEGPEIGLWNGSGTAVVCKNSSGANDDVDLERLGLTVGEWYYVSVYTSGSSSSNQGTFSLCITDQVVELTQKNNWCSALATFTNVGATSDGVVSSCGSPNSNKWFKFQASTSYINIDVKTGGTEGTIEGPEIGLWNGSGTAVVCKNSSGANDDVDLERLGLTVGEWYYVSVYTSGSSSSNQGTFSLCITDQVVELTQKNNWCSALAAFTNVGATSDGVVSSCGSPNSNKWFKFQASTPYIKIDIKTDDAEGTIQDPEIALWTSTGSEVGCTNSPTGSDDISIEKLGLTVGEWYYLSTYNQNSSTGYQGTFTLCITDQASFDYQMGAIELVQKNDWCSPLAGYSSVGATTDEASSSCGVQNNNVWFKFQAATDYIKLTIQTGGAEGTIQDPEMALWNSNGTEVTCVNSGAEDVTLETGNLILGEWYYISVYSQNNSQGTFSICVTDQLNLDPLIGAVELTNKNNWCSAIGAYSNVSGFVSPPTSTCEASGQVKKWFKFQAATEYIKVKVNTGGIDNTDISLWNSNQSLVNCGSTTTLELIGLTIGQWYYISISSLSSEWGSFGLCVNDQIPVFTNKNNWCSGSSAYSNVSGSAGGPTSTCEESGQVKTWFKFQAATEYIKVKVNTGGIYNTDISLWNSNQSLVSCGSSASLESIGLTIGQWYYVSVSSLSSESGSFELCVNDQIPVLTNKNNWCSGTSAYSNVNGSAGGPTSTCEESGQVKTWFKFQAATEYIKMKVNTGGIYNTDISLWNSNQSLVSCGSSASLESVGLTIGQWYYVSVSSLSSESGSFDLCVNDQIPIFTNKNNWCSSFSAYSNVNGSAGGPTSTCEESGQVKTWFKFQADTEYIKVRVNTGGIYNTDISLWNSNQSLVSCGSSASLESIGLTVGQWYYVSVSSLSSEWGSFGLCVNDQIPVFTNKNNWCSGSSVYNNVNGSTGGPTSTCEESGQVKTWFKFQADTEYIKVRVNTGGIYNTDISLWNSNQSLVSCGSSASLESIGLTIGQWYYVSVSTLNSEWGSFGLCVDDQINVLAETSNWCSESRAYSNVNGATVSLTSTCEEPDQVKTWFKFQASTAYMKLTVNRATIGIPDISLWKSDFTALNCISGSILETSGLTIGQWYYASVSSPFNERGTFGLCVLDNPLCILPQPTIFPLISSKTCNGLATGSITLSDSEAEIVYTLSNGQQKPGTSEVLIWNSLNAGTYTLSAQRSTCKIVTMGTIEVQEHPFITAQAVPEGLPVFCEGGSVVLHAFNEDGYSFQWLKDNAPIAGATQSRYEASVQGAYKVSVTQNGCNKISEALNVTTTTKPIATITPPGPTTFCDGGSVVLNGSTGTNYTFQWKTEDGTLIEGATTSSYTARTSGNYILATKLGGCSSESSPHTVTVNPLPVASIVSSGATAICQGATVTLKVIGTSDSYQWKQGTTLLSSETTDAYVASVAGSYRAVVARGPCSLETNAIGVTLKPVPSPVTALSGPATIPAGDTFNSNVTGNATDDLYIWNTPAGTNITYQNAKRSTATLGFHQLGEKIISVSAQKNGCESAPFEKTIEVIEAVSSNPSVIPAELKVSPDRQISLPLITRTFALNTLAQDQVRAVFEAPPCLEGEYYAGFQLSYDLADQNTLPNWTALVDITLTRGADILWTRSMQVDMATQTFVSTIFHDGFISCNDDYQFKIKTKSTNSGGVQAPEPNIYLKVLLYKRFTDVFSPTASLTLNSALTGGKIESSWNYSGKAAVAYDLEWVFIENHETFSGTTQQAFQFKEPVRVTTTDLSYTHHAYYPNGRLWVRARAVGYNPQFPKHRIRGQWFYGGAPVVVNNPEANKNWQLQTIFAEEGKYKKIVSYFDGSMRQRQVQTNLSTEDLTLVGESLYDFEGRKAVDVLPVPVTGGVLSYKTSFNTLQSSDPTVTANTTSIQKKFHYDNRQLINSIVSQSTGAGKYYSELNTIPSPLKDYIPDADGYVYNQTEYLNDGTGRVSRQSGVGEVFRMEGGKATRHYYAEAARVELTRLFGPNVGNASHYKKNVVVDGNGQVTVSYLDQADKVIATALAGTPPANVESLPGYQALPTTPVAVNLATKNKKANGTSQTVHKFLNEAPNSTYTFSYDLSALIPADATFGCQSCTYDFVISITDPDGKLLDLSAVPGNESGGTSYQRKGLTAASCSASSSLNSVSFNYLLTDVGDYTITKTLTSRDLSFEQIKTIVAQNAQVQLDLTNIQNSYVVDPADCDICTTCPEADQAIDQAIAEIADLDCEEILKDIVENLKVANAATPDYEPTQAAIEGHALYCKYQLCVKDKQSDVFDKQLARVSKWSTASAAPYNYHTISNLGLTKDPFFTDDELSGYGAGWIMQSILNATQIKGTPYSGTIDQVTDPENKSYYIDTDGFADPNGYHILYYSLMSRKAEMTTDAYNQELDIQRWTMFRNFYMEAKRAFKLRLTAYSRCPEMINYLKMFDELPQATSDPTETANRIYLWGKDYNGIGKGVNVPVSDEELEMHIAMLNQKCDISISVADAATIMDYLRAYFNSNEKNFLRLILTSDLSSNSNLTAVQSVLNNYGCSLGLVAGSNPANCIKPYTKTYAFSGPNLISNPAFTDCPASAAITSSCSGWKPAWGSPYLMSDKGFQLEATGCAQDALMGYFTTPLVPGKKYRLRFKHKKMSGATGGSGTYISISRSEGFAVNQTPAARASSDASNEPTVSPMTMIRCLEYPEPTNPDLVTASGGSTAIRLWIGYEYPDDYQTVERDFIPSQASTYIFFFILANENDSSLKGIIFKDVEVFEVTEHTITTCLEYAPLPDWQYEPNWADQITLCNQRAQQERLDLIEYAQNKYLEEQASLFNNSYRTNCIAAATEQLSYSYVSKEHHYTLYYYDQAGNLVQTVPPEGVKVLSTTDANSAAPPHPQHTLVTRYKYSSVNQLTWQTSPDAGVAEFYYDKKGQLRLSQNAQQAIDKKYSYTKYDKHGRAIEVGELAAAVTPATIAPHIEDPRFPTTGVAELPTYPLSDVTRTYYDNVNAAILPKLLQQHLRSRVSYVEVTDGNAPEKTTTYYSYDVHGNVRGLLQQIPGLEEKRTDYVYDLISGKVNYVFYQYGKADQLIHKYSYDADNRIKTAMTSSDAYLWNLEASYQYYAHGPLARTELGHHRVQGQDYYYTLQGWIKGVNMPFAGDPGADGLSPSKAGKDVYAYTLGYYQNDYKPSNPSVVLSDTRDQQWARYNTLMGNTGLHNGNIAWMVTDLAKIGDVNNNREKGMQAMLYRYDQLNRIWKSRSLTSYTQAGGFASRAATPAAYDEDYTYDGNGNILTLKRYSNTGVLIDDFNNQYYPNTNKLRFPKPVGAIFTTDLIVNSGNITPNSTIYRNIILSGTATVPSGQPVELVASNDITMSPDFNVQSGADFNVRMMNDNEGTYVYDAIGNLISDNEKLVTIRWTPYGKVREVNKNNGAQITNFVYDASGNRVLKKVTVSGASTLTHYVRDASGNVMGVYSQTVLTEQPIYGSSRLGEYKGGVLEASQSFGERQYELTNHLGNVLSVITDNVGMQGANVWAKVINASDYYPFGLEMAGRTFTDATGYRYGFNGKEKDQQGEFGDTSYDYGFRIYNPRIGKFLSVDPLTSEYPMLTPYQFASNTPIEAIDLDGLEALQVTIKDNGRLDFFAPSDRPSTVRHIPLPVKKEAPIPQIRVENRTTIGPNPFANELPSVRESRIRSAMYENNYAEFIRKGQAIDPFTFGGGEFGYGFARTTGEGVKQLPSVVLPELAIAKLANLQKASIVYRVIRAEEDIATGLAAKNPAANYTIEGHILHGSRLETQYISTTTDLKVAMRWADKTGNRIVEIDLSKVQGKIIDLSTQVSRDALLKGNTAKNFAAKSSEVLLQGTVPSKAIKLINVP